MSNTKETRFLAPDSAWRLARPGAGFLLVALIALTGCGGTPDRIGKTFPVAGKVTVEGKPLTSGTISFWPDASKGNPTEFQPAGEIASDGTFKLTTFGKEGAPSGWYKVVIFAREEVATPDGRASSPTGKFLVNTKYTDVNTTDQAVEVVENPAENAYHIKLQR